MKVLEYGLDVVWKELTPLCSFEEGGCFAAGTLVHTKTGLVPIEKLKIGDWVLAQPEMQGELAYKRVANTFVFEDKEVYLLRYASDDKVVDMIATGNHPFWVKDIGWTALSHIELGYELLQTDGTHAVVFCVEPMARTETKDVAWVQSVWGCDPCDFTGTLVDLRNGAIMFGEEGVDSIEANGPVDDPYFKRTVYNIEVEDFHTYYVGDLAVWVHNESIARRANAEDQCTGRFWEGRFKSQAILDEAGLLACCAYVDLNPIRAGMANVPEQADYTSIQQRLRSVKGIDTASENRIASEVKKAPRSAKLSTPHILEEANSSKKILPLHPFGNSLSSAPAQGLPCTMQDYIELVDWAARIVRSDKKNAMPSNTPPILIRLGFTPEHFLQSMQSKAMSQGSAIGQIERLKAYAAHLQKRCVMGVKLKVPILNSV